MNKFRTSPSSARAIVALTALLALGLAGCASPASPDSSTDSSAVAGDAPEISLDADYEGTFGAPPTEGPDVVEGANVWAVVCSSVAVGCQEPAESLAEAGEELGWKVTIVDGKFGVGDGYNVAIRQAIAGKADAIAVMGIDCVMAPGALQDAKNAGIPVVNAGGFDCDDKPIFTSAMQMNEEYPDFRDWVLAAGAAKARWLIDATDGQANVIVQDDIDSQLPVTLVKGFVDEMTAECPGCEIERMEFSGQDIQNGVFAQKFSAALLANPEANSVLCPLDSFCQTSNVVAATASAGRDMLIVGGEGVETAIEAVRNGSISVEQGWDTGWIGYAAADTVNRTLAGEDQVPQGLGYKTIDADHNLPTEGGFSSGVDYKSGYRSLWGLE